MLPQHLDLWTALCARQKRLHRKTVFNNVPQRGCLNIARVKINTATTLSIPNLHARVAGFSILGYLRPSAQIIQKGNGRRRQGAHPQIPVVDVPVISGGLGPARSVNHGNADTRAAQCDSQG